ncbi:MAG: hypothetical protein WCC98_16705 [Candidatus Acidiferrales bacterium]
MISEMDVLQAERFTPADEKDSAHGKGFLIHEDQAEPFPQGFFHSVSKTGSVGLGWSCWKCHLQWPSGAPREIKHCGRVDIFDADELLPTHVIGSHATYRAIADAEIVAAVKKIETKNICEHILDPTPTLFDRVMSFIKNLKW